MITCKANGWQRTCTELLYAADRYTQLPLYWLQALTQQFRKETIPWLQGLVQPFTQGPPPPLTNTVSPEALADADSKFVTVDGVRLHYKERGPASPGTPAVLLLHGLNGSTFSW